MKKTIQIYFAGLLFLVSGLVGYFLGDIIMNKETGIKSSSSDSYAVSVQPTVSVSTIPVVDSLKIGKPKRDDAGKYSFVVQAAVESGDQLKYLLFKDEGCNEEVSSSSNGVFESVPPSSTNRYYLRVENMSTYDVSKVYAVDGFINLIMYKKITKAELEKLFNMDKKWSAAPKGFSARIAKPLKIKVNGMKDGERGVAKPEDICMKIFNGIWSSVIVEKISYDEQQRMNVLEIKVNY